MDNYIINPLWIYFMEISDKIKNFSEVLFVLACLALAFSCICILISFDDRDVVDICKKAIKSLSYICLVLGLLTTFMPSKELVIKMIVAKNITIERVETAQEVVTKVYDDIMNIFKDSNEKDNKEGK